MTTALSGQQMTLPVSVGVLSCSSFGHSAWFTPRSGRRKCSVRRMKNDDVVATGCLAKAELPTAGALGLEVPSGLLLAADEVIE